jgi:hypothetical protein
MMSWTGFRGILIDSRIKIRSKIITSNRINNQFCLANLKAVID